MGKFLMEREREREKIVDREIGPFESFFKETKKTKEK